MKVDSCWRLWSPGKTLTRDAIQVWLVDFSNQKLKACLEDFRATLSKEEKARADGFKERYYGERYTLAHGVLRKLLAYQLGRDPSEVCYYYNHYGKPGLVGDSIYFNISYSNNLALLAFSTETQVGVDITRVESFTEVEGLISCCFSHEEKQEIKTLTSQARTESFFRRWAAKESIVKALGVGLFWPLDELTVFWDSEQANEVIAAPREVKDNFQCLALPEISGYQARLTVKLSEDFKDVELMTLLYSP
ncbi:MAG: 4'-phosphopantetheinyl transferase family protein [Chlamydiota bacterium]